MQIAGIGVRQENMAAFSEDSFQNKETSLVGVIKGKEVIVRWVQE